MTDEIDRKPLASLAFQNSEEFAAAVQKFGLDLQTVKYLCEGAVTVKKRAACRYSKFRVGAAVLTKDGIDASYVIGNPVSSNKSGLAADHSTAERGGPQIIVGVNVENASYPVGVCAERCALGTAVALGHQTGSFTAIAVSTDIAPPASPCGMCRQFIREFCALNMPIFMLDVDGKFEVQTIGELLPMSFGPEQLPQ